MGNTHGGNLRQESLRFGIRENELLDFSANINPSGYPEYLKTLYTEAFETIRNYPDPDSSELINAISSEYNISEKNIIAGNGGAELINVLGVIFRNRRALIVHPNFAEYERALIANGVGIENLIGKEDKNFKPEVGEISDKIRNDHDILYLSSPNNPVGYTYSRDEIKEIRGICMKKDVKLFVDEAFIDFCKDSDGVFQEIERSKNLIVLRSLTKIFAIPGIRLGYLGAGDSALIDEIRKFLPEWSVNSIAQNLGKHLITDKSFRKESRRVIIELRCRMEEKLGGIDDLRLFSSNSNYLLCKIDKEGVNAEDLKNSLGAKGVIIKVCDKYKGLNNNFFRVAVKSSEDNIKLTDGIREFLCS